MLRRLALVLVALVVSLGAQPAQANSKYAAIVVDYASGEVLHSRRADVSLYPASLTKMMTLMLLFDAMERGELKAENKLPVSRHAADMPASKLGLRAGSTISVDRAIQALTVRSANDVAVVIAEALGGDERRFAELMTEKARSIGMRNTVFKNASGLPNRAQKSTARDMALLAHRLIRHYSQYYHYFSQRSFAFGGRTYRSHNHLNASYRGMDGLKTGYTSASGFNLASSAVRDGRRVVVVVFGGRSARSRDAEVVRLMDLGFERLRERTAAPIIAAVPTAKPGSLAVATIAATEATVAPPVPEEIVPEARPEIEVASAAPGSVLDALPDADREAILAVIAEAPLPAVSPRTPIGEGAESSAPIEAVPAGFVVGAAKAPAAGVYAVQVGAFHDPDLARRAAHHATDLLPQILLHGDIDISPLDGRRKLVYRARLAGFPREVADRACDLLKAKRQDCLVVRTTPLLAAKSTS